jgi:hypothetical protein
MLCVAIVLAWSASYSTEWVFVRHSRGEIERTIEDNSGAMYVSQGVDVGQRAFHYGYGYWSSYSFQDPSPWEERYGVTSSRWLGIHSFALTRDGTNREQFFVISDWLLAVVLLALGIPAIRVGVARFRGPKPGCCRTCSYDLTGNTSGICPECGAATGASKAQDEK